MQVFVPPFPIDVNYDPTSYTLVWARASDVQNAPAILARWVELAGSQKPFACKSFGSSAKCRRIVAATPSPGITKAYADCGILVVKGVQGAPEHCVMVALVGSNGTIFLRAPVTASAGAGIGFKEIIFEIQGTAIPSQRLLGSIASMLQNAPYELNTDLRLPTFVYGTVNDHLSKILPSPWHESISLTIIVLPQDQLHRYVAIDATHHMDVSLRNNPAVEEWRPADEVQLNQYLGSVTQSLRRAVDTLCKGSWTSTQTFVCNTVR